MKQKEIYQVRVVSELEELEAKVDKLYTFLASKYFDQLPQDDQELLKLQYYAMKVYQGILEKRVANF